MLAEVLRALGTPATGYVAVERAHPSTSLFDLEYLGDDAQMNARGSDGVVLVNAIGSVDVTSHRRDIFERYEKQGFTFVTVVHPSAVLAPDVILGRGAQIMAGAVVQAGAKVGRNVIVNTRAVIDHDVRLADHVHVATGAVVAGGVVIGETSHIGAGAVIIQNLMIGRESLVAAGAVVVKNVQDGGRVAGVPARPIRSSS